MQLSIRSQQGEPNRGYARGGPTWSQAHSKDKKLKIQKCCTAKTGA